MVYTLNMTFAEKNSWRTYDSLYVWQNVASSIFAIFGKNEIEMNIVCKYEGFTDNSWAESLLLRIYSLMFTKRACSNSTLIILSTLS